MSFCASCGRQRNENSRFCGGCGTEFSDSPDAADDQGSPAADASDRVMTRTDAAPEMTRIEPPTPQTDPFASWYQGPPQGARNDAGSTWQPTQTVQATPTQAVHATPPPAGGYPSSGFSQANPFTPANPFSSANPVSPAGPPFPPAPPAGPPERGGMRGLFIALAVVVVLAAGGGAYALATTLGKHGTAQPTVGTSTSAGGSPTAGATQQASSPAATSASPTPSPTLSLVSIAPGVTAGAARPQVETLLSHYFRGINTHSYAEYSSTLTPENLAKQPESEFNSGYSSTTDSGMTLTSLSDNGGGLTATVTFTSRQAPAQSVDRSACNAWTLNLYLVPQGSGYLIGPAPSGYQPTYSDC
jgi:hypothetical protein